MEWTVFNVIICVIFALSENALFLTMRKGKAKRAVSVCAVLSVIVYAGAFCFLLLNGADMKQTMLVMIASLPGAFIPLKGENGK